MASLHVKHYSKLVIFNTVQQLCYLVIQTNRKLPSIKINLAQSSVSTQTSFNTWCYSSRINQQENAGRCMPVSPVNINCWPWSWLPSTLTPGILDQEFLNGLRCYQVLHIFNHYHTSKIYKFYFQSLSLNVSWRGGTHKNSLENC